MVVFEALWMEELLVEGKELDKTLTLTSEIVTPDNAEELLEKFGGSAE